ncbi:MAG: ATP cone domain-containing protein [Candidatus Aenigmarchaeota archaeon]|nr:ATP cone domain-containing protein [Candidatus Aenigmarchaeota archaeon]MDI6722226.1 ATP cone domain-containing protein [Candidatus Aenigmarchaeota archaeon]
MTKIWKRNGKMQAFSKAKVFKSCRKSGASAQQAKHVSDKVAEKVKTKRVVKAQELSKIIINTLRKTNKRAAAGFVKYKKAKYA